MKKGKLANFLKEEHGQGLTEYALVLSLVALAVVGALVLFGESVLNFFNLVGTEVEEAH